MKLKWWHCTVPVSTETWLRFQLFIYLPRNNMIFVIHCIICLQLLVWLPLCNSVCSFSKSFKCFLSKRPTSKQLRSVALSVPMHWINNLTFCKSQSDAGGGLNLSFVWAPDSFWTPSIFSVPETRPEVLEKRQERAQYLRHTFAVISKGNRTLAGQSDCCPLIWHTSR